MSNKEGGFGMKHMEKQIREGYHEIGGWNFDITFEEKSETFSKLSTLFGVSVNNAKHTSTIV